MFGFYYAAPSTLIVSNSGTELLVLIAFNVEVDILRVGGECNILCEPPNVY